ncbi:winged helix-turn-helix domain-containing protein [Nitratidesulfovibrio vulgaris]|uniref:Response regulator receiver protein n=1 Tax=Nitratidesulfovibrio vulgaris (strain DP4) TaxID=391774 RepID=A0A0H3A6L6_NITV4|nr:winged helix-turn-helix domain-containing protein [Nitratidesulfovibrio vulgaris]ABM27960.1 response regulator receiver protein [Nitratidesulfovibrio vulgaris DP4]
MSRPRQGPDVGISSGIIMLLTVRAESAPLIDFLRTGLAPEGVRVRSIASDAPAPIEGGALLTTDPEEPGRVPHLCAVLLLDRDTPPPKGRDAPPVLRMPFSLGALCDVLRAAGCHPLAGPNTLAAGELTLALDTGRVTRDYGILALHPQERYLLERLLRQPGRVLHRADIGPWCFDYEAPPRPGQIDVLVSRLRRRLDRNFERPMLHTMRGVGYVLHP